ncbi:alkyl sulfatase dimerization domain-containing protein [Altererythrobacter arenosus]|uniref:Alkyl sulfatase dimerization domain-containing protein n=1 Tax=Altererythrobacter arenosus TaxID=3032592 RepID=A0ABY8FW61_9SPHN|nr:alkyl sulfatase dimerization domain-containing protein [Altererythrobacter sp. CAU 1644]WFL77436.1 alkyl sulfatase dimerization domain-containing protein [Altererythrobacter sp. CAU 1644]
MTGRMRNRTLVTLALIAAPLHGEALAQPKPASPATIEAQRVAASALPADGERDAAFATRGFLATRSDPVIKNANGEPVWNLAAYDFVDGEAPATVHPSLWRHMRYLKHHGLFEVTDGVWQVRGFDLSNMTVVRGATGWILIDPLTTAEVAAAALELVNETLGERPVTAVVYSHSHADHFGGVRGVVGEEEVKAGRVAVIAPEHFMEEASSENVMAGSAMTRRAAYQFGRGLQPGPQGQMGSGIGTAVSGGTVTLIAPNDIIKRTGEKRVVDGVSLEFQIVSGSEAPAELNVYVEPARTFLAAEIATCTMHNILTPRGAKVRDTRAWAHYLDEAATVYAPKSDVVVSSHCWPQFGTEAGTAWLSAQRDNYRYLHDQTVRRMNRGSTMAEIAEDVPLPTNLGEEWSNHGYYGTYSHNSKAIYQYYLGWYDAVPANLHAHPPIERARRMVEALGGSERVMALARTAMASGDYRWASDLLQQLVFTAPADEQARGLLADSYEQQGYQAESAIWRNQFLVAADELRKGAREAFQTQSPDVISAIETGLLLDSAATRFDPTKLASGPVTVQLHLTDRGETAVIEANDRIMIGRLGQQVEAPDVVLRGPRQMILGMLFLKMPVEQMAAAGLQVEGDATAMQGLIDALDPVGAGFNIVLP